MPTRIFINQDQPNPNMTVAAGQLRVHIGLLPGGDQLSGLRAAVQRLAMDDRHFVIVAAGANEDKWRMIAGDNIQVMGAQEPLWDRRTIQKILAGNPTLVVLPELSNPALHPAEHSQLIENVILLLQKGVNVSTSLPLLAIERMGDLVSPAIVWPQHALIDMVFLRQYVNEYVVHDTLPAQLMEQHYQGVLNLPAWLKPQQASLMHMLALSRLREFMLNIVASHVADVAKNELPETTPPRSFFTVDILSSRFAEETGWAITINVLLLIAVHVAWFYYGLSFAGAGMLLLAGPLITALTVNQITSTLVGVLQFLGFNFFFMEPYFAFSFESTRDMLTLLAFVLTTVTVGWLANRSHQLAVRHRYENLYTKALLRFLYDISYREKLPDVVQAAIHNLRKTLGYEAQIVLADDVASLESWRVWPDNVKHTAAEEEAMKEAMQQRKVVQPTSAQPWLWCPLSFKQEVLGVLGMRFEIPEGGKANISLPLTLFFRSYADLLATSFRQRQLRLASQSATAQADRETLRSALLSSVSHDLKTPLVSIIGSLSTLEQVGQGLPAEERHELVAAARVEAERLHHIIHNVLEITKLESGQLQPKRESVELEELLTEVLHRCQRYYPSLQVKVLGKPPLPVLQIDPILMGQVFYNLYDNACKYAGTAKPLELGVQVKHGTCEITLRDFGPGLPKGEEKLIFDKFHRYEHADSKIAGSGLGLAICRGIVGAHGGTIDAGNAADKKGGTVFTISLPYQPTKEESTHE